MAALGLAWSEGTAELVDLGSAPLECHFAICLRGKPCGQFDSGERGRRELELGLFFSACSHDPNDP